MRATIEIPATPHACLSPNKIVSWRTKHEARRALKNAAFLAAKDWLATHPEAMAAIRPDLRLSFTVCWEPGRQAWDGDNLLAALKSATDGIARALWLDDAGFSFAPVSQVKLGAGRGCTRCVVETEDKR